MRVRPPRDADELTAQLKEKAPEGIDMYFENVGGMQFDAALASLFVGVAGVGATARRYNGGGR